MNRLFRIFAAVIFIGAAFALGVWLLLRGPSRAETASQCAALPLLQPEVPPVEFCDCFVAHFDSAWSRVYRATLLREGRELNIRSVIFECTASALRAGDRARK